MTFPVRRTPPPSIMVAMETVRGEHLFPQTTDRETEAQGRLGLGPIARAGERPLSHITTPWKGNLLQLLLGTRDSSSLGEEEGLCSSLPPGWGLSRELPKPCQLLGNCY